MEVFYQPIQIGIGLLLTGGLGLGLIRLGKLLKTMDFVTEAVSHLERGFSEFKKENAEDHIQIRAGISDARERLRGVETKVSNLPCNGRGLPRSCPEGNSP